MVHCPWKTINWLSAESRRVCGNYRGSFLLTLFSIIPYLTGGCVTQGSYTWALTTPVGEYRVEHIVHPNELGEQEFICTFDLEVLKEWLKADKQGEPNVQIHSP